MIEDLLNLKKISQEQYDLYVLFQINELGRKTLARMTHAYFMEDPTLNGFGGQRFAFYAGCCSVFKDIHRAINFVELKLKEMKDDRPKQSKQ